ncbi:uncharacterized protein LOC126744955 [Anthonomus grandis grandis]|uniref:uncharacterized protein LOC126744955 n=1 Tax=Anthonomus grandis grandis TaxID=2921223 RepID=UPI00216664A7|nr:uncharacterized protein LOC126744955 [Anthonomus grandis grandis]
MTSVADPENGENFAEKSESEESEEECSYITTRRSIIQVHKGKQEKKPDRLNGEYSYQNTIKQRVIGQPCIDCKMECDRRIAERFRQDNYLHFWGKIKSWEDRRTHVRRLVQVLRVPHPKNKQRKKFLRKYYLEMEDGFTLVCKTMFFNTLAISAKFIETTLQKYPDNVLDEATIKLVNNPTTIPKMFDPTKSSKKSSSKEPKEDGDDSSDSETSDGPVKEEDIPPEGEFLDSKYKQDIKPPCSCIEQCGNKLAEEVRLKIHEHFWTKLKSWEERKLFIINTIERDRYTSVRTFVLPMKDGGHISVCQTMYLNTLSLNEQPIDLLLPKTEPIKPPKRKYNIDHYEEGQRRQFTVIQPKLEQPMNNQLPSPRQKQPFPPTSAYQYPPTAQQFPATSRQIPATSHHLPQQFYSPQPTPFTPPHLNNVTITPRSGMSQVPPLHYPKDITKEVQLHHLPSPQIKRPKLEFTPLKPPCSCAMQCGLKLTDDVRKEIHREFWNLPAQVDKKHFILSTIQVQINKDKITKEQKHEIKHFTLPYQYDTAIVCREMYLNTLTVSEEFVRSTVKNINHDGSIIEDDDQNCNQAQGSSRHVHKRQLMNKQPGPEEKDFINCAALLESQIKEDVQLLSTKTEVRRKSRSSKKMGPPCPPTCRHQCSRKFKEEERQQLHQNFWCEMDWQGRKQFVMNTVKEFPIKNRSIPGRLTKRNFSRIYTLPKDGSASKTSKHNKITVCQKMYFNTLSICSKFVSTVHIWASQVKW